MENVIEDSSAPVNNIVTNAIKSQLESEKKIIDNVMSIRLSTDGLVIKDEPGINNTSNESADDHNTGKLAGVYCQGVQYYDLKGVQFINNTGMAILIDLLKSLLEMGVEVQFVNVDEKIKSKIKQMGLEKIINCGEKS